MQAGIRHIETGRGIPAEIHEVLDSTNAEARRRIVSGAARDRWIAARTQTAGRGRRGREWVSVAGNLYASRILTPACPPARVAELSFVVSLAVRDAVLAVLPQQADVAVRCKWPNDVLVEGAKVAGILLESEGGAGVIVAGAGINVASAPAGVEFPATCLAAHGAVTDPEALLLTLADAFEHRLAEWRQHGFTHVLGDWRNSASGLGQQVRVRLHDREVQGVFRDIDASGALVLQLSAGGVEKIAAGDVFFQQGQG